jgi:hypothetical protein
MHRISVHPFFIVIWFKNVPGMFLWVGGISETKKGTGRSALSLLKIPD